MKYPHDVIAAYAPTFLECTAGLSYIRRGVFWSELLAFSALAHHKGVKHVVESGTGLGFSANVMARLFSHVTTIGQEATPPGLPSNVYPLKGDSWECMWQYIEAGDAVLIDGPKGGEAVLLAQDILACKDNRPSILAVHDCQRDTAARRLLEEAFPDMWFSDDVAFVADFGYMDDECAAMAASRGKIFADHGPTLGILVL